MGYPGNSMIRFRIDLLLHVVYMLSTIRQAALDGVTGKLDDPEDLLNSLADLIIHFRACGLIASSFALERVVGAIKLEIDSSFIARDIHFFNQTLSRDLREKTLFIVPPQYLRYADVPEVVFGESALKAFPTIRDEVEDAARCISFGRSTSSMFHLMRIMEVGLKSLAKSLGIPYAPTWESYFAKIKLQIEAKRKTKGIRWKRDEPFFREVLGDLQNVKIAWRNPTMHVDRRYTSDEADQVFTAVRTFMGRLAERAK
jgi:hypothetical protein